MTDLTTIDLELDLWKTLPHPEQIRGMKHLITKPYAGLFDQPGVGKTKQIIDAACWLWRNHIIDHVIVVSPAGVRGVWDEPDLGELEKHCWVPYQTQRYDSDTFTQSRNDDCLPWTFVSYGYIRKTTHQGKAKLYPAVDYLVRQFKGRRFWLVLDESSYVKGRFANQYAACKRLSGWAERRSILNGTPVSNTVLDLFPQFMVLNPQILHSDETGKPMTYTMFKSIYQVYELQTMSRDVAGQRKIIEFPKFVGDNQSMIPDLQRRAKPYILRRMTADCVDLPPKVYSHIEATLSKKTWKIYCEMRDTLVAWYEQNPSVAPNGAVKSMRLTQITSGFLGGLKINPINQDILQEIPDEMQEIDDAKLTAFLEWFETVRGSEQIIVWARFRKELERLNAALQKDGVTTGLIYGGQNDNQRQDVINSFTRGTTQVLVGQPKAGGIGLNLTAAHLEVYCSNDYNLITREQSEGRAHRRGQTKQVVIYDILAKGPNGERTVDFTILDALKRKEDFANWTADYWRVKLNEP